MMLSTKDNKACQLREIIRNRIIAGEYGVNKKIPSARLLAEEFSVSPVTSSLAIAGLKSEGLVKTLRGSGTYVCDNVDLHENRPINLGFVYSSMKDSYFYNRTSIHPIVQYHIEGLTSISSTKRPVGIQTFSQKREDCFVNSNSPLAKSLKSGSLDGIVLSDWGATEDLQWLLENEIPAIYLGHYYTSIDAKIAKSFPNVTINNEAGFGSLVNELVRAGYDNMAFLTYSADSVLQKRGKNAYIKIAEHAGVNDFNSDSIITIFNEYSDGHNVDYAAAISHAIELKPDAIICADEVILKQLMWFCLKNDIDIPDEISVVVMNDIMPQLFPFPVTSLNVTNAAAEAARLGGEMLIRQIDGEDIAGTHMLVTPSIIRGESVVPKNSKNGIVAREDFVLEHYN